MRPIQKFIDKFGWENAKDLLNDKSVSDRYIFFIHGFCGSDLKSLVNSYDLVQSYGGLKPAKEYLHALALMGGDQFDRVYKAIADVENILNGE